MSTENTSGQPAQESQVVTTPAQPAPAQRTPEEIVKSMLTPKETVVDDKKDKVVVEEKKPEPVKEEVKDKTASKFAALARKEAEITKKMQELKAVEEKAKAYDDIKKQAKLNPKKFIEESGLSFQELAEFIINGEKPTKETENDVKYNELKQKLDQIEKEKQEEQEKVVMSQRQQAVNQFKQSIEKNVKDNVEKYELVALNGPEAIDLAYEVIEEHFNSTMSEETGEGEMLSIDDALSLVEDHLTKEAESLYKNKLSKAKKLSALFAPVAPQPPAKDEKQEVAEKVKKLFTEVEDNKSSKPTLSSDLDSSSPTPTANRKLTDEERDEEAKKIISRMFRS